MTSFKSHDIHFDSESNVDIDEEKRKKSVIISNIPPGTKKSDLYIYVLCVQKESHGGGEVDDVKMFEEGKAVVIFDEEEGSFRAAGFSSEMAVDPIGLEEEPAGYLVRETGYLFSTYTTVDKLHLVFKSNRWSGGGEIVFKICENEGQTSLSKNPVKKEKIISVVASTIPFIKRFFPKEFEELLQKNSVKYTWAQGSGQVVLSCVEPKKDYMTWEISCGAVISYINQIVTETIDISQESWELVRDKAKNTFTGFKDKVRILEISDFNGSEHWITLTGKKSNVYELGKELKDIEKQIMIKKSTDLEATTNGKKDNWGLRTLKKVFPNNNKKELLVKRCDQLSTRSIEDNILCNSWVKELPWIRDGGEKPVLVFCVISSRIGTDIENAMRGVHSNTVILVLLHHVLRSLLRGDLSDDEELLDTTLKNRMTGIAHFAFSDREGLYDCRQNTIGFDKLFDKILVVRD